MSATTDETVDVNAEIEQDAEETPANLSDAGKAAIAKERDARKQAAKEARELKAELDALKAKQQEADAEKAKADEAEAERKGEFERLATERAEAIKTVTGERDGLKAENDELRALLTPNVDAEWKALPDEIKAFFDGDDTNVIAKSKFLTKSKPALDKLAAQQATKHEAFRSVPKTPQPNGNGDPTDAAMDQARRSGKYKV